MTEQTGRLPINGDYVPYRQYRADIDHLRSEQKELKLKIDAIGDMLDRSERNQLAKDIRWMWFGILTLFGALSTLAGIVWSNLARIIGMGAQGP